MNRALTRLAAVAPFRRALIPLSRKVNLEPGAGRSATNSGMQHILSTARRRLITLIRSDYCVLDAMGRERLEGGADPGTVVWNLFGIPAEDSRSLWEINHHA